MLTLFALYVVAILTGAAVTVLTCGLGSFFVQPFWTLLYCVAYLEMTGQGTVEESRVGH
jgi:hypothetical protein